jgi:hypothetical protein
MGDLAINITKMGGSAATSQKVIGQLMGSFNATSDAWKAFIGIRNGAAGGGFAESYYATEQAGPGGDITKRNFNTEQFMKQQMNVIKGAMDTQSNPLNKQYMGKLIGQHMGLDETTVQYFMKGINSGNQMQAIQGAMEASKKAEREARPWAEQMADLLKKYVFIPLNEIKKAIESFIIFGGGAAAPRWRPLFSKAGQAAWDKTSLYDKFVHNAEMLKKARGMAGGGTVFDSGPVFAHRGEEILSPNVAEEYRKNKNRNNGGTQINITVNVEGDIDKAFDMAKKDTIKKLKQVHANTWG